MTKTGILIVRPDSHEASPADQALGARLSAGPEIEVHEQRFQQDQADGLERALASWEGKVSGVIGAMQVVQSRRLGALAERMNVLCFVANNNPSVWQNRRHVFHIGFPTSQTTAAVAAELVQKSNRRRYLLLHDTTEFQTRVASTMEEKLRGYGMDVRCLAHGSSDPLGTGDGWKPELIYLVFSSERKALEIVQALAERAPDVPLVLGRSLLRASFLQLLRGGGGEFWFVDTNFRRSRVQTASQQRFMQVMENKGIKVPTTNHAFGWDCMKFCASALMAGGGEPQHAIDYLESGVMLEGATGTCSFSPDNHNGRRGLGPTILSRWSHDRFEEV